MVYKRVDVAQVTILTHDLRTDSYTLEVRRDSMCIHGPRRVPVHIGLRCVDELGFKPV